MDRAFRKGIVTVEDVQAVLKMTRSELGLVAPDLKPLQGRGKKAWFRWRDVARCLGQSVATKIHDALAMPEAGPAVSRRWLGGYPDLVAQWHPDRNRELDPATVSFGSQRTVWWKCAEGPDHEWRARVGARTRGDGCPYCAGRRASVTNSLATKRPDVAAEWHPTRNLALTPSDVVWSSATRVWWKCNLGPDHEWKASLNSRTSNETGCPFCANLALSKTNSLARVAPAVAAQWMAAKNAPYTPDTVVAASTRRFYWKCPEGRDHIWRQAPSNRVKRGIGCPFCKGRQASVTNSLAKRYPRLIPEWDKTRNGPLTPKQVTCGSHRMVHWQCRVNSRHRWQASVLNRTSKASGCPYCAGRKHAPSARTPRAQTR